MSFDEHVFDACCQCALDHGLAYEAIAQHQVDAIDIYSTDAKIDKYGLTVLDDDRSQRSERLRLPESG